MKQLLVLTFPVLLAGTFAFAGTKTDFDHTATFSNFRTFAWRTKPPVTGVSNNSMVAKRIENAVDQQLMSKGMQKSDQNPDVYLVYHADVKTQKDVLGSPWMGIGWGRRWGYWDYGPYTTRYSVGTYVIDMIDAKTNQIVWRAYLQDTGSTPIDVQSAKKIDKLVNDSFKHFPPKQA